MTQLELPTNSVLQTFIGHWLAFDCTMLDTYRGHVMYTRQDLYDALSDYEKLQQTISQDSMKVIQDWIDSLPYNDSGFVTLEIEDVGGAD